MNFAEKIKADFEAITGLTLLYGSREGINWAINHNALPAGFFTLIRSSNVDVDGLSIKESAEVAVSVIRLSPAEEPGYGTEVVIEECRQQVFAYLTALKSSGLLELLSVTRASRIFDEFDDIVCGFGVNIVVKEIDGTRCIPWEGPTLNITENGDYETLRYGQVHVDVQGGTPAVVEPLTVTPTDEEQTITPTTGVDGFAPVVVGACPVCPSPNIQPLSVTPSTSNQTFTPSAPVDGYGPVDVAAVDSTIDHNIQPQNIKAGVDILGVSGAYHGTIDPLNVSPSTSAQTITPPAGTDGYAPVTVDAVTAAIDANITPGNIKKDVQILGVTGTMEPLNPGNGQIKIGGSSANAVWCTFNELWTPGNSPFGPTNNFTFGLRIPSVKDLPYRLLRAAPNVEEIELGLVETYQTQWFVSGSGTGNGNKLRKIIVAEGFDSSCFENTTAFRWTANDVIAEGQSGIDELNYNIKNYMAGRFKDLTGDTAKTVTFGASLYNVLTADTIQAFTAKNWNVASA